MRNLAKGLVGLSALALVLAVMSAFTGPIMNFAPGTYGRSCADLALLAIAVMLVFEAPVGMASPKT